MKQIIFKLNMYEKVDSRFGCRCSLNPGFRAEERESGSKRFKIDFLNQANTTLTLKLDSVSKYYARYYDFYTIIKDSVIKYNFDPAKTPFLLDSLKASRNSAFAQLSAVTAGGQ